MQDLKLTLTGPDAQAAAETLIQALTEAVGTKPDAATDAAALAQLRPRPLPPVDTAVQRTLDPATLLAGAAVLLAIPPALLAALDLGERIHKRRRAAALAETAARLRIEQRAEVTIVTLEGIRNLADLSPDQILALAAAARR